MNDKELSHIRMMANGIVAESNRTNKWASAVETRRIEKGAKITVSLRPGGEKPSDPMMTLGDLADAIRSELRLERTRLNVAVYGTSESEFDHDDPKFSFEVWRLDEVEA